MARHQSKTLQAWRFQVRSKRHEIAGNIYHPESCNRISGHSPIWQYLVDVYSTFKCLHSCFVGLLWLIICKLVAWLWLCRRVRAVKLQALQPCSLRRLRILEKEGAAVSSCIEVMAPAASATRNRLEEVTLQLHPDACLSKTCCSFYRLAKLLDHRSTHLSEHVVEVAGNINQSGYSQTACVFQVI